MCKRITVLVSGGGTNLGAIIAALKEGKITNGKIVSVISSCAEAYALERAKNADIKTAVLERKAFSSREDYSDTLAFLVDKDSPDLIILAGFMCILTERFCKKYENRIINVHPALIPSFCGEGFYGLKVHKKALEKGVKISGATVHFVTGETDAGPIILQKAVEVLDDDTPETLQKRIMTDAEQVILPKAVDLFCNDRLCVTGNIVKIKN